MNQTISAAWLRKQKACSEQVRQFETLFGAEALITDENVQRAREAGLDVLWALCRLLNKGQLREFIKFTLVQRQPHVVSLLRKANLTTHADAVVVIDWSDLAAAQLTLNAAAWAAAKTAAYDAGDAARDEQITWTLRVLGIAA